jgi:magnesium-protoporphyrin O-methyltransferase
MGALIRGVGCCDSGGLDEVFTERFARGAARRFRKRGLTRSERRIVAFVEEQGLEGLSVLEIGGGVGELHIELLRRGAARATNLELAGAYEPEAARLLQESGLSDRVERRLLDIAEAPEAVGPADVVVLHRVVCCYPDYERLLAAAGGHARRTLVFSHPPRNPLSRALLWAENLTMRVRGLTYRAFVHPPAAMLAVLRAQGLEVRELRGGPVWQVAGLVRPPDGTAR